MEAGTGAASLLTAILRVRVVLLHSVARRFVVILIDLMRMDWVISTLTHGRRWHLYRAPIARRHSEGRAIDHQLHQHQHNGKPDFVGRTTHIISLVFHLLQGNENDRDAADEHSGVHSKVHSFSMFYEHLARNINSPT